MKKPHWTAQEIETLRDIMSTAKTVKEGCEEASKLLDRTPEACNFKWYMLKNNKQQKKIDSKKKIVTLKKKTFWKKLLSFFR